MKSLKEYMVKEDKVDAMKHEKFNDIFQALERLNSEYDELDSLDRDANSTGVGDLTDQLTTMRKHIKGLYMVLDRMDSVVPMESVEEAVGDFAKPIYDLIDDLGDTDQTHANVLHDLIRYLDGDTIKDFVEEFRRVHDYGDGMEYESVQKDESNDLAHLKKLAGIEEDVNQQYKDVLATRNDIKINRFLAKQPEDVAKRLTGTKAQPKIKAPRPGSYSHSTNPEFPKKGM